MKKTKLLAFAFLATMFASCSNDNVPVDENKDTPIAIASAGVDAYLEKVISYSALPNRFSISSGAVSPRPTRRSRSTSIEGACTKMNSAREP